MSFYVKDQPGMKHPHVVYLRRQKGEDKRIGAFMTRLLADSVAQTLNDLLHASYYKGYNQGVKDATKPDDPVRIG